MPFATFSVLLLLMISVSLGCTNTPDQSAACPSIEVSVVADAPSDSNRTAILNDSTKIPLTRTPLVTSDDITGANASLTEGQWVVNIDVTDQSAKRVQSFSKENVGRTMAFLVNGKIHSMPRILDSITGKGFLIGGFERADAERLAAGVGRGCKRL